MLRRAIFLLAVGIAALYTAIAVIAQNTASPAMESAVVLFNEKRFPEAAEALRKVTVAEPQNGRAWYLLGMSLHSIGKYRDAIPAFEKNVGISKNPIAMYNIACGYAQLKEADKAFEWLERALKSGAAQSVAIESDTDLANIRNDPRFKVMIETADRIRRPCMYLPEARQFDFWVGEWDVFNTANQQAGTNSVQIFSGGCGLLENWTGTRGGDGKSLNFYDPGSKRWYQSWIGSGGGALRYSGNFSDGAMRFEGETIGPDGKTTRNRLTFFKLDENTVRQLAETSSDGGKTWAVSYDFRYVRRK